MKNRNTRITRKMVRKSKHGRKVERYTTHQALKRR